MSKPVHRTKKSNASLIPLILMMGFVPLIVHMYVYKTGLSQFLWYPDEAEIRTDMFFAWKMYAIIALGIVMIGVLLYRYFGKKDKLSFENSFYLLFFYGMFVGMSALFSQYKRWVVCGTYELFEPVWVVLIYMVICYYTYHFVQKEKQVVTVLRWAGIGILAVTLIGTFQYFQLDFFKTSLGKHLIANPSYWDNLDKLTITMAPGQVYTTLYNPNFLSFYFGMVVPLVACLIVAAKKPLHRIFLIIVEILALICLRGSQSDSGWLAIGIGAVVVIGVLLSRSKKTAVMGIVGGIAGLAAVAAVCAATPLGNRLSTTIAGTYHMEERAGLRDIETNDDEVVLDIGGNKMVLSYGISDTDGLSEIQCKDTEGNDLARTRIDETNLIDQMNDPAYVGCTVQPVSFDAVAGIRVTVEGGIWDFAYVAGDGYYLVNSAGKLEKFEAPKSAKLFREDAMSNRGHIWNLTIPMLAKHIFIGVGANAFMLAYPQYDYIFHAYVTGLNSYDVKAHCWYLQQWLENGLIGLLLLLGFMGWYVIQSARIYRKADLKESTTWLGIGLFAAVVVYLAAGIANDSNVCTAPLFWGVLGLGMAVNRMVVTKEKLFVKTDAEAGQEVQVKDEACGQDRSSASIQPTKKKTGKKLSKKQRMNQKKNQK